MNLQHPPPPNNCNGCIPSGCVPKKCEYCEECRELTPLNIEPFSSKVVSISIALIILIVAIKLSLEK